MGNLRLVEWNIGLKKKKFVENVKCLLKLSPTPDVIILTEVKADEQQNYKDELKTNYFFSNTSSIEYGNYNSVIIGVKREIKDKSKEIDINSLNNKIHPDWRMINLLYKKEHINILGVRFQNHNMKGLKKEQLDQLYNVLESKVKPKIIIGDFNVGSALSGEGLYWSKIKKELLDKGYRYYDATSLDSTFSFQNKLQYRNDSIGSTPDNVFVNITLGNYKLNVQKAFYHWEQDGNTDHAMLIVDFEIH